MTRYYIDTEIADTGSTIELISIGIACEDGRELYLQSCQFSPLATPDWVRENVLPHLLLCPHAHYLGKRTVFGDHIAHLEKGQCTFERPARAITGLKGMRISGEAYLIGAHADCFWRTREQIKNELLAFLDPVQYGT